MTSSRPLKLSVLVSIAFVALLFVGLPMLWIVAAKAKIRQGEADALKERKAAQAEHLPLTANDLRRNPPVSDNDNAAPIYRQIFAGFKSKSQQYQSLEKDALKITGSAPPSDESAANLAAARKLVALAQPELALMAQAAQKPECDFHYEWEKGVGVLFPEYADMRKMARLLVINAELLDRDGKPLDALKQIEMGAAMVRHLGQEPVLIGMLVQIALEAIIDREWHRLVNRHGTDAAYLARAEQVNTAFGDLPSFKRSLRGEVWMGMSVIEQMKKGTFREEDFGITDEQKSKMPKINPAMAGIYEKNHLAHWRKVFQLLDAAGNDSAKAAQSLIQDDKEMEAAAKADPQGQALNALLTPVFAQAGQNVVQTEALRRMRVLKLELLKYRLMHGSFPKDLSGFEAKSVLDPFSGKPLIYRLQGNGYLLYSVGRNGVDDGGQRKVGDNNMADIPTSYP